VNDAKASRARSEPLTAELLRRTFGVEVVCKRCKFPFHLIALTNDETVAKKLLTSMQATLG
jgi:hypothetical protein